MSKFWFGVAVFLSLAVVVDHYVDQSANKKMGDLASSVDSLKTVIAAKDSALVAKDSALTIRDSALVNMGVDPKSLKWGDVRRLGAKLPRTSSQGGKSNDRLIR